MEPIELRPLVAPFSTADAAILVDLDDLVPHARSRLSQALLLVGRVLIASGNAQNLEMSAICPLLGVKRATLTDVRTAG